MRVFLVSLVTLIIVAIALLMIRFWGLGLPIESFDHPWFHQPTPWIVVPENLAEQAGPQATIWIDVVRSEEQNLYSVPQSFDTGRKWHDEDLSTQGKPLKESLARWSDRNLVLNVRSNVENIDVQISDLLGKSGNGRVLVQSDFDLIMRAIKKLQPLWLFGASQAERVRFRSFESLGILPATPFKGDVYVGPFKQKGVELLTESVFQEMKRRQKRVIVGPLQNKEEKDLALRLGADGLFIDQPELLGLP